MKKLQLLFTLCFAISSQVAFSQIVINEFDPYTSTVEIKNTGASGVNVSSYRLCSWPTYTTLGNLTLENGNDYMLMPGEILTVSGHSMAFTDDELGLYLTGSWSSASDILDYVEWGSHGHTRSGVAESAGIWDDGDFISPSTSGNSISWDGSGNAGTSWTVDSTPTFGEENESGCAINAASIINEDFTICAGDGVSDEFTVTLEEPSDASNEIFVITEEDLTIVGVQTENTFDLEGAGAGVCLIWHLSYEDDVNLDISNAGELDGCFALSNALTVTRNNPVGGTITNEDFTMCAGDGVSDEFMVMVEGQEGTNSIFVITDEDANVIAAQAENTFDLEGAGAGVCLIWHLSYEDDVDLDVANAGDLTGCFSLSNALTVTRNNPVGGTITNEDFTMCAGDGVSDEFMVMVEGQEGTNSIFVITDEDANIIAAQAENTFDLEGAGAGVCLIWHLSYEDDVDLGVANAGDLTGCFSLSNALTVTRNNPVGGTITNEDFTMCAGDGMSDEFEVMLEGQEGTNSLYVITDEDANIIAVQEENVFDLEGAGAGVCLIWHLSYEDDVDLNVTNAGDLTGCFSLSNALTVTRNNPIGGTITNEDFSICAGDGMPDEFMVMVEGQEGTNSIFVITDTDANIIAAQEDNTFDLDGAGPGVCLVWHLSYEDDVDLDVANAGDLTGCYSLSNALTVTRNQPMGGTITNEDFTMCAGDGVSDEFEVVLEGQEGTNSLYVITDEDANIIAVQEENVFDLEGAGAGVCLIWHLSYEDDVDLNVTNAGDLTGCFSLSNALTVTRNQPMGGVISTEDNTTICASDGIPDPIEVTFTDVAGTNSLFVITDEDLNILGVQTETTFDLSEAGPGVCLIWHLSYEDDVDLDISNAAELSGCYSLSNAITVTRLEGEDCDCLNNGGIISTMDPTTICAGDGSEDPITVDFEGVQGTNGIFVVTDVEGNIIATQAENVFDFDGAGAGVCVIWHLSYEDDVDLNITNASELEGCFDLSNPIEVTRNQPEGGTIATEDNTEVCSLDGEADEITVTFEDVAGTNSLFVITDEDLNIIATQTETTFDFDGAEAGVCLIWAFIL